MRMSHIYQPVMIKCLLEHNGHAPDVTIAKNLLQFDPSQLEYYQSITNNMVGKVLRNHQVVSKEKSVYSLSNFDQLTKEQVETLIRLCEEKVDSYIQKRGDAIWQHRRNNRQPVSGSVRYQVLKRAQFRCELCGISANEKALEVDHIVPKNSGGVDSINNYQALCYSCNATKRDTDATDFREMRHQYEHRAEDCIFCKMEQKRIIQENNLAYLILDQYPVTPLHCLAIPKRHTSNYFEVNQAEINALNQLILFAKEYTHQKDALIDGFNIGLNCGEAAGQTVMHTHMHLIPRREGDLHNPRGGIRNVIPGKGAY
jgi:diadenosine tetraphosphate (Ap4A) HIT family hydrolase/5-methylcytosine-specific restriction endonuclease McrA